MAAMSVVAVDDTNQMCDEGNEGGGTAEDSKKMKEPIFMGGVLLFDFDNTDVPDEKLLGDSEDTDDEEASNREHMDVDISAPSCVQTVRPSSSTTST